MGEPSEKQRSTRRGERPLENPPGISIPAMQPAGRREHGCLLFKPLDLWYFYGRASQDRRGLVKRVRSGGRLGRLGRQETQLLAGPGPPSLGWAKAERP